jgi:hypothetical protein
MINAATFFLITIEKKKEMAIVQGQYREQRGHTKEKNTVHQSFPSYGLSKMFRFESKNDQSPTRDGNKTYALFVQLPTKLFSY